MRAFSATARRDSVTASPFGKANRFSPASEEKFRVVSRTRRPVVRHRPAPETNRSMKHRSVVRNLSPNGLVASISTRRQTDEQDRCLSTIGELGCLTSVVRHPRRFERAQATSAYHPFADISLHRSEPTRRVRSRRLGRLRKMIRLAAKSRSKKLGFKSKELAWLGVGA
jgi:hypothetical protein